MVSVLLVLNMFKDMWERHKKERKRIIECDWDIKGKKKREREKISECVYAGVYDMERKIERAREESQYLPAKWASAKNKFGAKNVESTAPFLTAVATQGTLQINPPTQPSLILSPPSPQTSKWRAFLVSYLLYNIKWNCKKRTLRINLIL